MLIEKTKTYCDRMKPNIGSWNEEQIDAKMPTTAIHLGV